MRIRHALGLALALTSSCAPGFSSAATFYPYRGTRPYALDELDRTRPTPGVKPKCDPTELVSYRGKVIRYDAPALVHPAFAEHLSRYEAVVRDVSIEIYGRAPRTLHHAGGFSCRPTASGRLSEHALGNALDVEGFSLPPLGKKDLASSKARGVNVDPKLRGALRLRVGEAWGERGPEHQKRFFALLLERLRREDDLFRAIIGPPDPGHRTHLHFDMGPWPFDRFAPPT